MNRLLETNDHAPLLVLSSGRTMLMVAHSSSKTSNTTIRTSGGELLPCSGFTWYACLHPV